MNYEVFLYSKTFHDDWNLFVVPKGFSSSDTDRLKTILRDNVMARTISQRDKLWPTIDVSYCFPLGNYILWMRGRHAGRQDKTGRPIWDFAGIAVEHQERRLLKYCLPKLINSTLIYDQTYEYINVMGFAPDEPRRSQTYSLTWDPSISLPDGALSSAERSPLLRMEYGEVGHELLLSIISEPRLPLFYFVFGPIDTSFLHANELAPLSLDDLNPYRMKESFSESSDPSTTESNVSRLTGISVNITSTPNAGTEKSRVRQSVSSVSTGEPERVISKTLLTGQAQRKVIYEVFLFTKTQDSDWAFFALPSKLTNSDIQALQNILLKLVRNLENVIEASFAGMYCFPLGSHIFYICAKPRIRLDLGDRYIWDLFGCALPNTVSNVVMFKECLLTLLNSTELYVQALQYFLADGVAPEPPPLSKQFSITYNADTAPVPELEQYKPTASLYNALQSLYDTLQSDEASDAKLYIPFDIEGRTLLEHLVGDPLLPLIYFAYGLAEPLPDLPKEVVIMGIVGLSKTVASTEALAHRPSNTPLRNSRSHRSLPEVLILRVWELFMRKK